MCAAAVEASTTADSMEMAKSSTEQNATTAQSSDKAPEGHTQKSMKALAREFCDETTAHGFGSFIREQMAPVKVFWAFIILCAMVGSSFHLYYVINTYLQYQTQEIVRVSHVPPPFPDVTVCNLHAESKSTWLSLEDEPFMKEFQSTIAQIQAAATENGDWEEVEDRARTPVSFVENAGWEQAKLVGHQPKDFLVQCTFAGRHCQEDHVTQFVDGTFYNCYTFHRNETSGIGSGPSNALSLILYLEAKSPGGGIYHRVYNSHSPVENAIGARVVIHSIGSLPQAVNAGYDVMPGDSTSFTLATTYLERLHEPYGQCTDNATLSGMENYTYTSFGCLELCKQQFIIERCGCLSALLPVPGYLQDDSFCGTFNASIQQDYFDKTTCETDKWYEFDSSGDLRQGCQCYTPCHSHTYDVTVAQSQWPGDEFTEDFYTDLVLPSGSKAGPQLDGNMSWNASEFADLIRANFVRVNVYFHDLDVTSRVQEASFVLSNLWSSVGGTLGLWAGISVITVTECLTFFTKLAISSCQSCK